MIISDKAKELIMNVLTSNDADAVRISTQNGGCSKSLSFDLVKKEEGVEPELINDVPTYLDDETREWTANIIIESDGQRLQLINPESACGSCKGCS